MERNGILAAGNWIIDHIKIIDTWPEQDALANILHQYSRNGGSPYNLLKDLKALGANYPLAAAGTLGKDENGEEILGDCNAMNINTDLLESTERAPTSYTDVMSVESTGRRTFFHNRGANALFTGERIDFAKQSEKIFHLGYLLLLDALDLIVDGGSTKAAQLLAAARKAGMKTSVDIVSESGDRFEQVVPPALPHVDYLFVNEYEASRITDKSINLEGSSWQDQVLDMAKDLVDLGVKEWVILHFPSGALALSKDKEAVWQEAVSMPKEKIVGASGAGDAFAAGTLHALHQDRPIQECLKLGVCTAASSLMDASCSDSIMPEKEALQLFETYGSASFSATKVNQTQE